MPRETFIAVLLIILLALTLYGCGSESMQSDPSVASPSAAVVKTAVSGCSELPCLAPSQGQSEALFKKVELLFPQYFSSPSATQSLQSGSDTIHYRVYANQFATGLASYLGGLWYAVGGQWYRLASLDEANQVFCSNACWSSTPASSGQTISGTITANGSGLSGVSVTLTGGTATTTNADGVYSFSGIQNGTYAVTPLLAGYAFTPASSSLTVNNASVTGKNFVASNTGSITVKW